jgi:glucokinase
MTQEVLALDIGGTNSRIAIFEITNKGPLLKKKKIVATNSIKDISKFINSFNKKIENCCIGLAGPVIGTKAKLTNVNLTIDVNKIKKDTILKEVTLINDFQARGHGIKYLSKNEKNMLHRGKKSNNISIVVGPGTGLGKVHIIDNNVYPCEPGWTTIGISNIDDYALMDYLKNKFDRQVYYEDILSGRGLIDIYDHLEIKSNLDTNMRIRKLIKEEPVHQAKVLVKYSSKDKLCDMTLRIFAKFYARYVKDSCLNLLTGKVYLIGGMSNAIKKYLKKEFMDEFTNHDVYSDMLKNVKIELVTNENIGLIGAAAVAAKLI